MRIQPDLFGAWAVWVAWGRIGRRGRLQLHPASSRLHAECAAAHRIAQKTQRGYQVSPLLLGPDRLKGKRKTGEAQKFCGNFSVSGEKTLDAMSLMTYA